jgi:hypothetical protein
MGRTSWIISLLCISALTRCAFASVELTLLLYRFNAARVRQRICVYSRIASFML